jgi:hypothetical protein
MTALGDARSQGGARYRIEADARAPLALSLSMRAPRLLGRHEEKEFDMT